MTIKPTVGRVVRYIPTRYDRENGLYGVSHEVKELPAMVVRVLGEGPEAELSINVFPDGPRGTLWITKVPADFSPTPKEGTWHWPPIKD